MTSLSGATTAVFIVKLSAALGVPVNVAWQTKDGTAKAGTDYEAASGSVTFDAGETQKQIQVVVYGRETGDTATRKFNILLYPPENAILDQTLTEVEIQVTDSEGVTVTSLVVATGPRGLKGDPGLSAYELAKIQGFEGTLQEWLEIQNPSAEMLQKAEEAANSAAAARDYRDQTQQIIEAAGEQSTLVVLAQSNGLKNIGGKGYVNPQAHGATPGNGSVDNTAAVKNAIAEAVLSGATLDLSGGPWRISETIDFTNVKSIRTDFSGRFLVNPTSFTAAHTKKYAITFGNPDTQFGSNRCSNTIVTGYLMVASDNRDAELNGVYVKGALLDLGSIRATNFNGHGFRADAWWDSTAKSISVEMCGNLTSHAFYIGPYGDTSNCLNIGRIQVERSFHKQLNINAIRSVFGPIHAERLKILTLNDGSTGLASGLTYENSNFLLSNSTLTQLILDAAEDTEAGTVTVTPSVRLNLYASKADSLAMRTSVVTSSYGQDSVISNSIFYKYYNPSYPYTLIACRFTRSTGDGYLLLGGAGSTAINCIIDTFQPDYGTSKLILAGCTLNNDYSNSRTGVSGVLLRECVLNGGIGQTGPTEGNEITKFKDCTIKGVVAGYYQHSFIVEGGWVASANLASRSYARFRYLNGGTFNHADKNNRGYITIGCTFETVTAWGYPQYGNYKSGELTQRIGDVTSGTVYEYINTLNNGASFIPARTIP